ncbi:hypothetical protein BMW23_0466 [Bodo saltans virus]|uniref:Uncharacterized protein n=1 Tax=Bodo saltans virus TaxID=2024608 RepID=A0A2H4UUD2_9VIRU|nr:hypothetical protein QJ851_gp0455 [Bodo saltans virus]ATZ80518.1 hypothetical protein BMW23_0466 [Bodo saltans virus]
MQSISFFDKIFYFVKYKINENNLLNPYKKIIINNNVSSTFVSENTRIMNKIYNNNNKIYNKWDAKKKVIIHYHGKERSFYTVINAISFNDIHAQIKEIASNSTKFKKKNICKSNTKIIKSICFIKKDNSVIDITEIINEFIECDTDITFNDILLLIEESNVRTIDITYFNNSFDFDDFDEKNIKINYDGQNINIISKYLHTP